MKNTSNIQKKQAMPVPDHSASQSAKGEMGTVKRVADTSSKPQPAEAARKVDNDWAKYRCTDDPCESGH